MVKPARRQHFIARFYLRNFAEPMLSDNLCVYDLQTKRWEKRTPEGVGWFPHLCSLISMEGRRSDEFDRYLKVNVEDPAVLGFRNSVCEFSPYGLPTQPDHSLTSWSNSARSAASRPLMCSATTRDIKSGERAAVKLMKSATAPRSSAWTCRPSWH